MAGARASRPCWPRLATSARRYDLYRAKMYGPRRTTMTRLRELERAYQGAEARLRRAQQERAPHDRG
jgi:hypothetical protein